MTYLASYTWLYVGSWAIGLGAFLIASTFRPLPKQEIHAGAGARARLTVKSD